MLEQGEEIIVLHLVVREGLAEVVPFEHRLQTGRKGGREQALQLPGGEHLRQREQQAGGPRDRRMPSVSDKQQKASVVRLEQDKSREKEEEGKQSEVEDPVGQRKGFDSHSYSESNWKPLECLAEEGYGVTSLENHNDLINLPLHPCRDLGWQQLQW